MEKEVESNGEMRFICVICGRGVFPSPISIDNRVVCIMNDKGNPSAVSHKSPPLVAGSPGLDCKNTSFLPGQLPSFPPTCSQS